MLAWIQRKLADVGLFIWVQRIRWYYRYFLVYLKLFLCYLCIGYYYMKLFTWVQRYRWYRWYLKVYLKLFVFYLYVRYYFNCIVSIAQLWITGNLNLLLLIGELLTHLYLSDPVIWPKMLAWIQRKLADVKLFIWVQRNRWCHRCFLVYLKLFLFHLYVRHYYTRMVHGSRFWFTRIRLLLAREVLMRQYLYF